MNFFVQFDQILQKGLLNLTNARLVVPHLTEE